MTTISQELNQLERAINQTLTSHRERLTRQQEQIQNLTQLIASRKHDSLDPHCLSAMNRLIELLETDLASTDRVYDVLTSLTQAKDAPQLTIDSQGEIATYLKVELAELAQRLQIDPPTKLSAAVNHPTAWAKLMAAHADPDGYQWQCPSGFKRGFFYHQTHLHVTGTKTVQLAPSSSLN